LKHWVRLEARPPGLEGKGELTLDILTKNSLRMRPDRILVGEIRHDEAFTLFTAMNTGHAGSMGTVHSNSPQETIIRVTSPPMSVPEVMLSGLDLIIVEHRIHDKKKGTIRRLTEIAEVTGVLEGKAQTQTIFERDPVEDTIARTNIPIRYLKRLQNFTGLGKKQIEQELAGRKNFLNGLVKRNIRSMQDVSREMHSFLLQKRES
jgi:flagellar protein FlaI